MHFNYWSRTKRATLLRTQAPLRPAQTFPFPFRPYSNCWLPLFVVNACRETVKLLEKKKKKRKATRSRGCAFQFRGWNERKRKPLASSFFVSGHSSLLFHRGESYEFFSRFNFPATFFRDAFECRLHAASNDRSGETRCFQRGHTRQMHYFCSPRFVSRYSSRRWLRAVGRNEWNELRYYYYYYFL